jgi:predicted small secreted protein
MSANTSAIPTQLDDPEPGSTWFFSLAGIVILVALVVAASVMYFHAETRETDVKVVDPAYAKLEAVRGTWREQLGSYQRYPWTEPDGKVTQKVRIPVERAMEIVVKEGLPVGAAAAPAAPAMGARAK